MNLDDLSLLSDNQIDYGTLPDSLLRDLTLGDDLFIATSALVTLSQRRSKLAQTLASDILEKGLGDRYIQAAAIDVLFDMNPTSALDFITKQIQTCDAYLFNVILELMVQNYDYFNRSNRFQIIEIASKRLNELDLEDKWPTLEVREKFFASYGS